MLYIDEQLKREGITRTELAQRMGMARNTLFNLLKNPLRDNIIKLAEALHCRPRDIMAEERNGSFFCPHCGEEIFWEIDNDK